MNMRKIIFSILAVTTAFFLMSNSSCKRKKENKGEQVQQKGEEKKNEQAGQKDTINLASSFEKDGFVKATVVDNTGLDGCRFMLLLESGQKVQPLNLEENFLKDGMKVWVKYTVEKDAMSVCMAGEIVKIISIGERK